MTATTIKVDHLLRDRLKAQAAAGHRTLGEHLAHLADAADRAERFGALRTAVAATPPEELAGWERETNAWEGAELRRS
jgi:predicted transcriptional regulator